MPFIQNTPWEFIDIVWTIREEKPKMDWELFATIAWSLWNHRNLVKHGGQCKETSKIAREATEYIKEFR